MEKRIAVLTGGGDAPGQNVCLKTLVTHLSEHNVQVLGIRKGWEGLLNYNPDDAATYGDNVLQLNKMRVRDIDRMPGAFLHSSRLTPDAVPRELTPPFLKQDAKEAINDFTTHILRALQALQVEAVIAMGDRMTLRYAAHLSKTGFPVIGIPKTVHNDINGSDYSIGFSTALERGVRFIYELRAMAASREEIAVVEILGRTTGLTTMLISYLAGADRLLIPEVPFDPARLADLLIQDKQANPSNYAILVISENARVEPDKVRSYLPEMSRLAGARTLAEAIAVGETDRVEQHILADIAQIDRAGFRISGIGPVVTEILENLTRQRMLFQSLSYLIRTGEPDGQDLLGAVNFGAAAARLYLEHSTGRMVAYRRRDAYTDVPLALASELKGNYDVAEFYDAAQYLAKPGIIWSANGKVAGG